jgi:hypothetical protein
MNLIYHIPEKGVNENLEIYGNMAGLEFLLSPFIAMRAENRVSDYGY